MTHPSAVAETRSTAAQDLDLRQSLLRFVEGRLRDRSEGEDIVQEAFLRLCDYRRTRTVADVGAFCFAVARNLLTDRLRQIRRRPVATAPCETLACPLPLADEVVSHRQRVRVLADALTRMPPLRREVFLRRRLDEDSPARICADLGLSASAVEKHVTRALSDLRAALAARGLSLAPGR